MTTQREDAKKILFAGLDNAGKTSIILTLSRDFDRLDNLQPTKGREIKMFNFLGMLISEWDLGGQKVYRQVHLREHAEQTFSGATSLIFVIDTQDKDRTEEAYEYLTQIIDQLKILSIQPKIFCFFHKFDPLPSINVKEYMTNISLKLRNRIKAIDYPNIEFYRTSIYDLKTILIAMSKILLSESSRSEVLKASTQDFGNKSNYDSVELIDDNSLLVATYYRNKYTKELMNAVTPYFLQVNDIFRRASVPVDYEEEAENEMMLNKFGKFFLFRTFFLKKEHANYYILGCKKDSEFDKKELELFVNVMKEILSS
jgi:GTPase SAR1 family protein